MAKDPTREAECAEAALDGLAMAEQNLERTTEVRQRAQRNQAIITAAPDGFFSADLCGRILSADPAFCAMLGYRERELLQLSIPDIEANEGPAAVAAHIEKLLARGHDRFDTRHRRKDGSLIEVEMSETLIEQGGEKLIYGFVRDIGSRKAAEAELILARDKAERANRAKSEFLLRMSHELRTPLNAVLGFSEMLELENLSATQLENVREITHAGRQLLELVDEIHNLSRSESGHVELAPQAIALRQESGSAAAEPETAKRYLGTILYVEDNPTNLRLMRQIIEKGGKLKMLDAMTAESGLAMAKAEPPDLILMDINLPGMNGHEALQALRADPLTRDIPIIAITANALKKDYEHGLAEGFDDYVTKPVDVGYLTKLLRDYLEPEPGSPEEAAVTTI